MAKFQNPGGFFICTLAPSEQKFLKISIGNALKNGYTKFIEPCAGAFTLSHLAVQAGFKPNQIEASDISMFTSIMGYAITGQSLEKLCLQAKGFSDEELLDPATALYAWKYLSLVKNAGKDYFYNYLIDMEQRREEHINNLREKLNRAKNILGKINYRVLDMWKHLDEVADNPNVLVVVNPLIHKAGFEKIYDTNGNMTWKEPEYNVFDPATDLKNLLEKMKDAKCLFICYEESASGKTIGTPIFARYGVREGVNVYLVSNRPDEAEFLAEGKKISRPNEQDLVPLNCEILPVDYEISEASKVSVVKIEQKSALYYRKLWTHNFTGSSVSLNFAIFIDDKIAGVFGIDKSALIMGAFGKMVSDSVFLMYGMTVPHKKYRLNRLTSMLAQNKNFVMEICTDLEKEKAKALKTVQMTKYPEALEMRGIMKLVERNKDAKFGYRLTYKSGLKDRNEQETIADMGSGLIIAKVPASHIREQDINARIMKTEMQKQLIDNIKKRGQLESLPFCALTQDDTKIEIVSGHHRIRSGKDAGLKNFFVILDISGLNRSKITAKQIAHNAISGFDDRSTLKELAKMLEDVDDMIESYAGKEILTEANENLEKYLSPAIKFDWKNIMFMFLPHQISDLDKLVEFTKRSATDYVGVASVDEYKPFIETLSKYQNFVDIKNVGAAIHAMVKLSLSAMENAGYNENVQWIQLSNIFGASGVSKDTAEIISNAVQKMIDEGKISPNNKFEFLKILAEKYLAGD